MLIDSHHHLWKYFAQQYPWISDQMSVLRHDFWTDELKTLADENGIDGFVSVQARQSLEETETLLALAESEPLIKGVVGWVDFASDQITAQLDRFADQGKLKGLRHVVQDEPDDRFILGADFNRGIRELAGRDLVYDVLIFARQLEPSIEFVRTHDDIPMVLDHIAKPTIKDGRVDAQWESQIRQIAALPNLACKFSGVVTEVVDSCWDIETVRPYWDIVLDAFGPSRLMYGSDWPVCLLRTHYDHWLETVRSLAGELSSDEQEQFFGGTAKRIYHLE
ncbi:amidohydrolase family protein [Rhodopirellula sp. JC639]|uniref:amidohydrolase family protein n=1 Tax=Stieleria mannarensis TaxID=2755585 RepID=UPI0016037B40|nr:amidohydrolase family protein [Rhodopirellula sp. JC639]